MATGELAFGQEQQQQQQEEEQQQEQPHCALGRVPGTPRGKQEGCRAGDGPRTLWGLVRDTSVASVPAASP